MKDKPRLAPKLGYKMTEIGEIPEEWETVRLGEVAKVFSGASAPQKGEYFEKGTFPFVRVSDLAVNKRTNNLTKVKDYVNERALKELNLVKANRGTLVFPKSGAAIENNNRALLGTDAFVVSHLAAVYPAKEKASNTFLYYLSCMVDMTNYSNSPGYPTLKVSTIKEMLIPLPPLPEQQKIAEILSAVDEAIQKTEEIIQKTQELKKGFMQQLLTRGIGHTKFKQTEIGEIPEEWAVKTIEQTCEILDSQRIPLNEETRKGMKGNIPYYGANGLLDYISDHIFDDKLILIAEDGGYFEDYQNRPIAYLVEGKCWVNNHAHVLKVRENGFVTEYIFYTLEHRNILPFIKGSTRSKLNQKDLRSIRIPVPSSSEEQQKIAEILSTVDEKIEVERQRREKLEELKKGLMQVLLTGKVRVR